MEEALVFMLFEHNLFGNNVPASSLLSIPDALCFMYNFLRVPRH